MTTDYALTPWIADAHLLGYLAHTGEQRSRERIAALYSVYRMVRGRICQLDNEFRPYIDRLTNTVQAGQPIATAFPPERIRERFCSPALTWDETNDVFWGLPDTISLAGTARRLRLSCLEGAELQALMKELATEAKSRALSRFYVAFLAFFVERIALAYNSDGISVWSCVDEEYAFYLAIEAALTAVEHPEVVTAESLVR